MSSRPVGLFDSGIGGTSIWHEIVTALPKESTLFLADNKNAPYGEHSQMEICHFCEKNVDYLLSQNCKLIVVACNTATTNAIKHLRQKYHVPFIGIEPAIKPAALLSQNHNIGILATAGTLASVFFHSHEQQLITQQRIHVVEQAGIGIVDLIEAGKLYSSEMSILLKKYIQPFLDANIDTLVLGCTHYPYLRPQLQELLPQNVKIIDSGAAVAKHTKRILKQHSLLNGRNSVNHQWVSSGSANILSDFLPRDIEVSISTL